MTSPGMSSPKAEQPNTSVCPRCGAGFRCGMVAGDAECWCVQLPRVMPVPSSNPTDRGAAKTVSAASCFCPACLRLMTEGQPR